MKQKRKVILCQSLRSFNSFEDETKPWIKWIRCNYLRIFQFLWGWNRKLKNRDQSRRSSFNSFEDETLALLVMGNWGICTFNSFEDETWKRRDVGRTQSTYFQFLWGWNTSNTEMRLTSFGSFSFQFLWGWNPHHTKTQYPPRRGLSIPLRMKLRLGVVVVLGYLTLSIPLRMKPPSSVQPSSTGYT